MTAEKLFSYCGDCRSGRQGTDPLHGYPFLGPAGMYIQLQGGFDIGVSQDLTETFHIHSPLDASCGEGMTQNMEITLTNGTMLQHGGKPVLQASGIHRS